MVIAVLCIVLMVLGGIGVQAYRSLPPQLRQVQSRMVQWDAAGDGSAYRIHGFEIGTSMEDDNTFERLVDLDGHRFLLRNRGNVFHQEGPRYYYTHGANVAIGMDHSPNVPFEPMPALVLNRTGDTYRGILGSYPFTLELDEKERFSQLDYRNHRGVRVRLTYSYENVVFPDMEAVAGGRNAANLPLPEPGMPEGRVPIDWNQDARRPRDLSARFIDSSGIIMAETPFSSIALPPGFGLTWEDRNENQVVDEGDVYSYEHPEGIRLQIFDTWADQPVGSRRLLPPWDPQWDLVTPSWRLYILRQSS